MMSAAVKKVLTLLPAVPREIKERFGKEITYRQAYNLVLNGQVSAKQKNGRYELDVNEVAEVLGLTKSAA